MAPRNTTPPPGELDTSIAWFQRRHVYGDVEDFGRQVLAASEALVHSPIFVPRTAPVRLTNDEFLHSYWSFVAKTESPNQRLRESDVRSYELCFPQDHGKLVHQYQVFFSMTMAFEIPRYKHGENTPQSIRNYRECMLKWAATIYPEQGRGAPDPDRLIDALNEVIENYLQRCDMGPLPPSP